MIQRISFQPSLRQNTTWYLWNEKSGYRIFANKIFANRTFANGESPLYFRRLSQNKIIIEHVSLIHNPIGEILGEMLAEVQWTFASGESAIW
jgi:hypothetical protein